MNYFLEHIAIISIANLSFLPRSTIKTAKDASVPSTLQLLTAMFLLLMSFLLDARSLASKIPDLNFILAESPYGVSITEGWCKPHSVYDAVLTPLMSFIVMIGMKIDLRVALVLIHKLVLLRHQLVYEH